MKKTIRNHYVTARFSDVEFAKLNALMHLSGYNNRSKFIREALLARRYRRRYFSRNEANVSKQIELLRVDIKRIGVNYNQRVKALNRLALLRDRNGAAVVNARDIDNDMQQMKRMMEGMVKMVTRIREVVLPVEDVQEQEDEDPST